MDEQEWVYAEDMAEGRNYSGKSHVGDFKKENGKYYFKGVMPDDEWIEINPHPRSIFKERPCST